MSKDFIDREGIGHLASDVILTWFADLDAIESALRRGMPKRFKVTLPDHEQIGSATALQAFLGRGIDWFAGRDFEQWSALLEFGGRELGAIRERFESRTRAILARVEGGTSASPK